MKAAETAREQAKSAAEAAAKDAADLARAAQNAERLASDARACVLDGDRRQEIGVVVEPSRQGWGLLQEQGRAAMIEQLRQRLSLRYEPVLMPKHFRFRDLPRNAQGKVVLDDLRALLREQ